MQRKFIYMIIAVLIALFMLFMKTCNPAPVENTSRVYSLDSLQYLHETNMCKFDTIQERTKIITKLVYKIRNVQVLMDRPMPEYTTDSLTALLNKIVDTYE